VDTELRLERRLLVGRGIQEVDPDEPIEIAQRIADRAEPAAFGSKSNDHRGTRNAWIRGTLARVALGERRRRASDGGVAAATPPERLNRGRARSARAVPGSARREPALLRATAMRGPH